MGSRLSLPRNTTPSQGRRVPYCVVDHYDQGTFLDYPVRAGWPEARPTPGQPPFLTNASTSDVSVDLNRLESFIQAWLFFGLLHELFGPRFDESRYTSTDEHGKTVHTENLKTDLDAWARNAKSLPPHEGNTLGQHLRACLILARDTMMAVKIRGPPGFNRDVRLSITMLLESVAHFLHVTLPENDPEAPQDNFLHCYVDEKTVPDMVQDGWCPYRATATLSRLLHPSSVQLVETIAHPDSTGDHSRCSPDECHNLKINEATYRPSHTTADCGCHDIAVPIHSLGKVLDSGALPLLRLRADNASEMQVHVESSANNQAFVALSHVWAQGLGNTRASALPSCQLFRLMQLVQRLMGRMPWQGNQPECRDLLFWCDTICVPVVSTTNEEQNKIRALAMERMRDVYAQAAYVLVLDEMLENLNIADIGLTEAGLRIISSSWMNRLWTYQEATLPKCLLFQFLDKAIDLREIWAYHRELWPRNVMLYGICIDIITQCLQIRTPFHSNSASFMLGILELTMGLNGRSVSYAADEPLCLTTILNLDMARTQQVPENRRMEEVWTMMPGAPNGIPRNIVLESYPRLTTSGFRWAPSTLLTNLTTGRGIGGLCGRDESRKGRPTPSGLLVEFAGCRIRRASWPDNIPRDSKPTQVNALSHIMLRAENGSWYRLHLTPISTSSSVDEISEQIVSQDEATILILEAPFGMAKRNRLSMNHALVTKKASSHEGQTKSNVPILHSLTLANLTPLPPHDHIFYSEAYSLVMRITESSTVGQQTPPRSSNEDDGDTTGKAEHIMDPMAILKELLNLAEQACQDEQLKQKLPATGNPNPESLLTLTAAQILDAQYLVIEEVFSEETMWCID